MSAVARHVLVRPQPNMTMNIRILLGYLCFLLSAMLVTLSVAQESPSIHELIVGKKNGSEQDIAGIERLHQQDAAATLSDKADEFAKLWDNDAVRIQPGHPAEVGKAVIYANDKHWEASKGNQKTLCGEIPQACAGITTNGPRAEFSLNQAH